MNRLYPARTVSLFALLVWQIMLAAASAGVQTPGSTAAIMGRITDATGAVLSGATVALSGEALMGTRTTTSSSEGFYRFPAVPPGEYLLVFSCQGFTRTTRGIHVGPGFTATVDLTLLVADVQADVTVSKRSTIIDKYSTAVTANFNARELSDLPTSRSIFAILSATPLYTSAGSRLEARPVTPASIAHMGRRPLTGR
jgi:hypothetical protein